MTGGEAQCTVPSDVAQSPSNLKDQKGSYDSRARTTRDMLLHGMDSCRRTPTTLNILAEDPVKRDDKESDHEMKEKAPGRHDVPNRATSSSLP
ncbi:hypothetical protein B296_00010327 [Ensete ventricosum]|uniref:Uncharacterized protein n=1 Tax=Ensete ventricosum TaxID=4639 RepID=A0A427A7L2_ENSVE|nr:hypothetical protein B296_00010327 [Ensete ventricosum]